MPYDSNQTARLIAMQQQQYSQQAQMAEQIGSMGMPYNTGGYDPRSTANRIGGVATSATLGALPAIGGGLGMMGMLGGLGVRALKPFIPFDPFSAGFAAHSAVGGGSAGVMAGLGVGGAIAGVGMAAGGALQQMYQGAQGYNQIGSTMQNTYGGVFRPQQMEMGGQGFGASERGQMAGLVRKMAHIPELMTNVNELNSIFQKMDQTGMMSGAVNVDDLGRRFKEGIKALRGIGKMLGTTMEEAMPLFNEARQSGFFSATDIMANATQRRFVGGVLGMGQQQVGQIQQSGADLMTAMGGSQRGIGAAGALNQASMLQMAVRTGVLGEERLGAATGGLTGTRGVQSLLGTFQRAGARMSQGSLGQLITAAASETEGGNLTGKIDQDILEQVQAGELSLGELKQMASRNISGKKKAQFAMNREDLTAQVAAQGPGAMVGMLRTAVEDKGIGQGQSFDDVASHILKTHTDMTKAQRDVLIDITKKSRD
ncbi:MAG TPA: hypothetical protein VM537_31710, partial [Anaerolineae bacterium]|nr:hypothetical protein [Anaerolineae bacterium]